MKFSSRVTVCTAAVRERQTEVNTRVGEARSPSTERMVNLYWRVCINCNSSTAQHTFSCTAAQHTFSCSAAQQHSTPSVAQPRSTTSVAQPHSTPLVAQHHSTPSVAQHHSILSVAQHTFSCTAAPLQWQAPHLLTMTISSIKYSQQKSNWPLQRPSLATQQNKPHNHNSISNNYKITETNRYKVRWTVRSAATAAVLSVLKSSYLNCCAWSEMRRNTVTAICTCIYIDCSTAHLNNLVY
jgi:hypothetical protein